MVVVLQRSITQSAILSIGAAILVDMLRRRRVPSPMMLWNGLSFGGRSSMQAVAACAAAGVLVGIFALTGLGNRFVMLASGLGGEMLVPSLGMIMVLTLLMGFPLPTVPAYVITGMIGAPIIIKLGGVTPLVAHLFVMYYACISTVTPPVGLAAFAAAGIAGANPYKTGFTAMRLGLAAYIIPFVFIFNDHLLGFGTWYQVLSAFITALAIAYALACAVNSDYHAVARLAMVAVTVPLFWPGVVWDVLGIALLLVVDYFGRKTSRSGGIAPLAPIAAGVTNVVTGGSSPAPPDPHSVEIDR